MAETYCGSSPTQTKLRLSPLFLRALNMRYAILFALKHVALRALAGDAEERAPRVPARVGLTRHARWPAG